MKTSWNLSLMESLTIVLEYILTVLFKGETCCKWYGLPFSGFFLIWSFGLHLPAFSLKTSGWPTKHLTFIFHIFESQKSVRSLRAHRHRRWCRPHRGPVHWSSASCLFPISVTLCALHFSFQLGEPDLGSRQTYSFFFFFQCVSTLTIICPHPPGGKVRLKICFSDREDRVDGQE